MVSAPVTVMKPAALTFALGLVNLGVFVTLYASVLNAPILESSRIPHIALSEL